jgi:hypothetical protein
MGYAYALAWAAGCLGVGMFIGGVRLWWEERGHS